MALDIGLRGKNERVVVILKHLDANVIVETIGHVVEVLQHGLTAPPPHEADDVWVHPRHED